MYIFFFAFLTLKFLYMYYKKGNTTEQINFIYSLISLSSYTDTSYYTITTYRLWQYFSIYVLLLIISNLLVIWKEFYQLFVSCFNNNGKTILFITLYLHTYILNSLSTTTTTTYVHTTSTLNITTTRSITIKQTLETC